MLKETGVERGFSESSGMRATMLGWVAAVAAGVAWSMSALGAVDYVQFEAQQLVRSPQSAWARPILFTDELTAPVGAPDKKLDQKKYAQLCLKTVGPVWVPEAVLNSFAGLAVGKTYTFGGTVDSVRGKYYIIVDTPFSVQSKESLENQWSGKMEEGTAGTDDPVVQNLLVTAQNRLIRLAQEQGVSVEQLVEAQTDGGQRIAETIVAESLQSQLRESNQTAEQVMIDAVVALLQKEAATKGVITSAERQINASEPVENDFTDGNRSDNQEAAIANMPRAVPEPVPDEPEMSVVDISTDDVSEADVVAVDVDAPKVEVSDVTPQADRAADLGLSDLVIW